MSDTKISQIETFLEHAEAKIMLAENVEPAAREELYQEAADLLIRAEGLMKGCGAWLMSCMHARRENEALCIRWLERARKASMLPDLEIFRTHAHFAKVRETRWFTDWLKLQG